MRGIVITENQLGIGILIVIGVHVARLRREHSRSDGWSIGPQPTAREQREPPHNLY
jgi:hypothetical protein